MQPLSKVRAYFPAKMLWKGYLFGTRGKTCMFSFPEIKKITIKICSVRNGLALTLDSYTNRRQWAPPLVVRGVQREAGHGVVVVRRATGADVIRDGGCGQAFWQSRGFKIKQAASVVCC